MLKDKKRNRPKAYYYSTCTSTCIVTEFRTHILILRKYGWLNVINQPVA